MNQGEKANLLRALHQGPEILVIANAWDVPSARIVEQAGARAVGTTSAGVAWALGYADGQQITRREMLDAVARITNATTVPVTADVEAGYGTDIDSAVETARGAVEVGAVGLNLEDDTGHGLLPVDVQVGRIQAVRATSSALGVPLVINARTDIYLANIGPRETMLQRTIERLNAYRDAGADCVFVPGVTDLETIRAIVAAVPLPLNVLATPGLPSLAELKDGGVRRVSVGSGLARAAYARTREIAEDLLRNGAYGKLHESQIPYANMQNLMTEAESR